MSKNLGGIMFWVKKNLFFLIVCNHCLLFVFQKALDLDDFTGNFCNQGKFFN